MLVSKHEVGWRSRRYKRHAIARGEPALQVINCLTLQINRKCCIEQLTREPAQRIYIVTMFEIVDFQWCCMCLHHSYFDAVNISGLQRYGLHFFDARQRGRYMREHI